MIAGVDEVGRGCLAGPVIAASVILKRPIKGLMDSKKLSSKKREDLSQVIIENSIFAIGTADNQEIDQINILQASLMAMQRSLEKLDVKPKKVLVDGNKYFNRPGPDLLESTRILAEIIHPDIFPAKQNIERWISL